MGIPAKGTLTPLVDLRRLNVLWRRNSHIIIGAIAEKTKISGPVRQAVSRCSAQRLHGVCPGADHATGEVVEQTTTNSGDELH